jgi:hypothetical protein
MSVSVHREPSGLIAIRVTGKATPDDWHAGQREIAALLAADRPTPLLVILDRFQGRAAVRAHTEPQL